VRAHPISKNKRNAEENKESNLHEYSTPPDNDQEHLPGIGRCCMWPGQQGLYKTTGILILLEVPALLPQ